jgi:hypothetical protein
MCFGATRLGSVINVMIVTGFLDGFVPEIAWHRRMAFCGAVAKRLDIKITMDGNFFLSRH